MAQRSSFVNYPRQQSKRKRARLVCTLCHDRKIKCDLQSQSEEGSDTCTNCQAAGNDCRLRTSHRGKRLKHHQQHRASSLGRSHLNSGHNLIEDASMQNLELPTPPLPEPAVNLARHDDTTQVIAPPKALQFPSALSLAQQNDISPPQPWSSAITNPSRRVRDTPSSRDQQLTSPASIAPTQQDAYLGETDFLQVYDPETRPSREDELNTPALATAVQNEDLDLPPPGLRQSFSETFFEYCYAWSPILDKETVETDLARSPLLCNALATTASRIRPPILKHTETETYYDRAKKLFYDEKEPCTLTSIQAIMLFYWWNSTVPTMVNRNSTWWWTGIAIRQAQQMGLHRDLRPNQSGEQKAAYGLRRRIWWTLFARERLTAVSQGRPVIIQPDDCNTPPPSLRDFAEPNIQAEVFVLWVGVCGILGDVGKHLLRAVDLPSLPFPVHLAEQLIQWVDNLPQSLDPGIRMDRTVKFHRDIHQLHLHYLTTIILLNLKPKMSTLPDTYPASAMAATCIARIMKDYLSRGAIRYLPAITSWCCGLASLALLHVRKLDGITNSADEDLNVLKVALTELTTMWASANFFLKGLERLRERSMASSMESETARPEGAASQTAAPLQLSGVEDDNPRNSVNWIDYFPFASTQTSPLAAILLREQQLELFPPLDWSSATFDMQDLFDPFQMWTELPSSFE